MAGAFLFEGMWGGQVLGLRDFLPEGEKNNQLPPNPLVRPVEDLRAHSWLRKAV